MTRRSLHAGPPGRQFQREIISINCWRSPACVLSDGEKVFVLVVPNSVLPLVPCQPPQYRTDRVSISDCLVNPHFLLKLHAHIYPRCRTTSSQSCQAGENSRKLCLVLSLNCKAVPDFFTCSRAFGGAEQSSVRSALSRVWSAV